MAPWTLEMTDKTPMDSTPKLDMRDFRRACKYRIAACAPFTLKKAQLSACLPAVIGECASHLPELVQSQLVVLIDVHFFEEYLRLPRRDSKSFEPFLSGCAQLWIWQQSVWPVL